MQQQKDFASSENNKGTPLVVKIVVAVLLIIAVSMVALLLTKSFMTDSTDKLGKIKGVSYMRVGENKQFSLQVGDTFKQNTDIEWIVDGKTAQKHKYDNSGSVTFDYQPMVVGEHEITLKIGRKYRQSINVTVGKPVLNVAVDCADIVYGEELPNFTYTVSGYVKGYGEKLTLNNRAVIEGEYNGVGIYRIIPEQNIQSNDYEVEINYGQLTVSPKQLKVTCDGQIVKTYDGNNKFDNVWLQLDGVLQGDEVGIESHTIYTKDKNVGKSKLLDLTAITLIGEDSHNYTVDYNSGLVADIVAKKLQIVGITADSKDYDGTDKVDLNNVGSLLGVVEGDKVAIGTIEAKFQDAQWGKDRKVIINNVVLVGQDKDNYTVDSINNVNASVFINYMNLLLNRPNVVESN